MLCTYHISILIYLYIYSSAFSSDLISSTQFHYIKAPPEEEDTEKTTVNYAALQKQDLISQLFFVIIIVG
jgi:hypothetical protein